jgi:uncharacterized membrane protein YkvA (DUF1232 family)
MGSAFLFLSVAAICLTIITTAFMYILSLPQSHVFDVCKNVVIAIACLIYIVSPIDLLPEAVFGPLGLCDDLAALVGVVVAGRNAMKSKRTEEAGK